jgi:hypothetical protein
MKLLYLAPVPLASFAQRPHHFVRWVHERFGARVLWIDPPPARLPRWADVRRLILNSGSGGSLASPWTQQPWIERLHLPAIPLEPWAVGRAINGRLQRSAIRQLDRWVDEHTWLVLAKPCALALTLCRRYANRPTMFDVMDAVPEFSSGASKRWLSHCEAFLATCCTRVVVSAPSLLSRLGIDPNDPRVSVIPNGLEPPPPNHSARRVSTVDRPPRFVYVGVIADWFDWDVVTALARRFPFSPIRLYGPCYRKPPPDTPSNVVLCGPLPHEELPIVLEEADIGLIPFLSNSLTHHVDPVKYYEYRAAGLGVLSTRFGTMANRGVDDQVLFFDTQPTAQELKAIAKAASHETIRQSFCTLNAWPRRFEGLASWFSSSAPL